MSSHDTETVDATPAVADAVERLRAGDVTPAASETCRSGGPGFLFHAAAGATMAFVVTVLALVATLFADPAAPVNIWLNTYAPHLLGGEVVLILFFGIAAMARDQWQQSASRSTTSRDQS